MKAPFIKHLPSGFIFRNVLLLGAFFILSGCDDQIDPPPPQYSIQINNLEQLDSLEDGTVLLGCAEDQNRDTSDQIEYDLVFTMEVPSEERSNLIFELTASPNLFQPKRNGIPINGEIKIEDIAWTSGEYTLTAEIKNGTVVEAELQQKIKVEIDPESPLCRRPQTNLVFASPLDGATLQASDDLDQDLTNGLQIPIEVYVEGVVTNQLVEIKVNGVSQGRANVDQDRAVLDRATLPIESTVTLSAIAQGEMGLVQTEVQVNIEAQPCELAIFPQAQEGCDLGTSFDVDPETPGLQVELRAESTCSEVSWTINTLTTPWIPVIDGEASFIVTLNGGENTLSAQGRSADSLNVDVDSYVLDINLTQPIVNFEGLNQLGQNRFLLDQAQTQINQQPTWTLSGFTSDLAEGSEVELIFDPPLEGELAERISTSIAVDSEGRFTLDVSTLYLCDQTLKARVVDPCGGIHESPVYTLCFDGVIPELSVTSPEPNSLIHQDLDFERSGLQSKVVVEIIDAREEVDYRVYFECRTQESSLFERVSDSVLRSEIVAAGGELLVSFDNEGVYECRLQSQSEGNPSQTTSISYRVITDVPTFEVLDPSPEVSQSCVSDRLFIGGRGTRFGLNQTQIRYFIRTLTGEIAIQGTLPLLGNGNFGTEIRLGPQGLNDGAYTLEFEGESGGLPIAIIPLAPLNILVDRTPPELGLISPTSGQTLGLEQDRNQDLSDCVQTPIEVSLNDQSADTICYQLNQGVSQCVAVNDMGTLTTEPLNFLPGENQLVLSVLDCTGETQVIEQTITTQGCERPLRLSNPLDRSGIFPNDDEDDQREGWQVTISVEGEANESVNITVSGEGQNDLSFGPVSLDENGQGQLTLDLPVPTDTPLTLTLSPQSERTGWQTQLILSNQVPTLTLDELNQGCIGSSLEDVSSETGFQVHITGQGSGLAVDQAPRLSVQCGEDENVFIGQIEEGMNQQNIRFDGVTLVEEGSCQIRVSATSFTGENVQVESLLEIDRVAPTVRVLEPEESNVLTLFDDQNQQLPGIQYPLTLEVCGANGQPLDLSTTPPQPDGALTLPVGEGECVELQTPPLSFTQSEVDLTTVSRDACRNTLTQVHPIRSNVNVSVLISEPRADDLIGVSGDQNVLEAGCQIEFEGITTGFVNLEGVEFAVCSQGRAGNDPLCNGQHDVSLGSCVALDEQGRSISCQLSLDDGEHELVFVVGQNDQEIQSNPVSIYADCFGPQPLSLVLNNDQDQNGCINEQERLNQGAFTLNASVNLNFEVEGMEEGSVVSLRALPGERLLAQGIVSDGQGDFIGVTLTPGLHELYLTGRDRALNSMPTFDSPRFNPLTVRVDTLVPQPTLIAPQAGQCLGIDDDLNRTLSGLQFAPEITTGNEPSEEIELVLNVDQEVVQRQQSNLSTYVFDTQRLSEGDHDVVILVQDQCGNVGSVSGFETQGNQEIWTEPRSFSLTVDLNAPTLILDGVSEGQILQPQEDANQNPQDGFQYDIMVNAVGFETGQEVRIYSGDQRLRTTPDQIFISAEEAEIPVRITLPPGPHALNARGVDLCDNTAPRQDVSITVDIQGCSSELTSVTNEQLLGPNDGTFSTSPNRLRLNLEGRVDLLDPRCAQAQAELILNGGDLIASTSPDPNTGRLLFSEVSLPEGEIELSIRTRLEGELTDSLVKQVSVDLTAPTPSLTSPTAIDGMIFITEDTNPTQVGQQFDLTVNIRENPVLSTRKGSLSINGQIEREQIPIESALNQSVTISGITAPAGSFTVTFCVEDLVLNENCFQEDFEADPQPPNEITPTVGVLNNRTTAVSIRFVAPGDDLAGGDQVDVYEIRWSRTPFNNETTWNNGIELTHRDPSVLPGEVEQFTLTALPPNEVVYLAIRARDDADRLGGLVSVEVDLTWDSVTLDLSPSASSTGSEVWGGGSFDSTSTNSIMSIGDFDQDGFDDLLIAGNQISDFRSIGRLVFGKADPSDSLKTLDLVVGGQIAPFFNMAAAQMIGDVNGDGGQDLGIISYTVDFSGTVVSIYYGCPPLAVCTDLELQTPDVFLDIPGVLRSYIAGVGDFVQANGVGFDDFILGGGVDGNGYTDPRYVTVVSGRDSWPNQLTALESNVDEFIFTISPNEEGQSGIGNVGAYISKLGDINQDSASDFIFSGGGNLDRTYVVYGGSEFQSSLVDGNLVYSPDQSALIELVNPCDQLGTATFGTYLQGGVDLTGDQRPDFIVGNRSNKALIVFNHQLELVDCFARSEDQFGSFFDLVGDLNGDGEVDLITTHESSVSTRAHVFYNQGNGLFGADQQQNNRQESMRIDQPEQRKVGVSGVGDFNGDGQVDLGVISYNSNTNLFQLTLLY